MFSLHLWLLTLSFENPRNFMSGKNEKSIFCFSK